MSGHLDELNPAQREAVLHTEGPLLVLAGAGAGKTKVVAHRIGEIVRGGVAPSAILAITFTNKAAREMRERVMALLEAQGLKGYGEAGPFVSTFHSLGLHIIKENYRALGLKRLPVIYDRADSTRAMKESLKEIGAGEELDARAALGMISRAKGDGLTPGEYEEGAETPRERLAARAWARYEKRLADDGALDFDDLLARAARLLKNDAGVLARYRAQFKYIHIDEYQDTNRVQSDLAGMLVGPERNICAVGDIDQTIYTWRGAEIKNIMSFEKEYAGAKVVVLEENYRSTKTILTAANDVIAKNQYRVEKNMFTRNADGEKLSFYHAMNENDEAARAARLIGEHLARGAEPRDFAILYRANFQSRALEEALLAANIKYQVLGTRFFERAEVKDTLAFIRAALHGADADLARIINVPPRGIGKVTLLKVLSGREGELRGAIAEKVASFRDLLHRLKKAAETKPPSELVRFVVKEAGIERDLSADKIEGQERLDNLRELAALASRYDSIEAGHGTPEEGVQQFLEAASLASDQDELKEDANAVRLMTVHASKGLEFPYVFITGLEEGLFPYAREGESDADREEERRLMYVALTRAGKRLFLSCAAMRTVFGSQSFTEPSQFLADIPPDLMEAEEPERLGRTIYLD